jgi:SAM-dependent methyltransferase
MTGLDRARASYDKVAERYAEEISDELADKPIDRALYRMFAELIHDGQRGDQPTATGTAAARRGEVGTVVGEPAGAATIGEVGCGPGHVAAYLASLGLDMVGVDPSPGMLEVARRRFPGIGFTLGSFADLPGGDAGWAGAVAPYSIIHVPPAERPAAWAELARRG